MSFNSMESFMVSEQEEDDEFVASEPDVDPKPQSEESGAAPDATTEAPLANHPAGARDGQPTWELPCLPAKATPNQDVPQLPQLQPATAAEPLSAQIFQQSVEVRSAREEKQETILTGSIVRELPSIQGHGRQEKKAEEK